ncbi:MAG: STM4011 family radical SAM protein [Tannerellaceae bacterium]|jgi:hydroxymethylpyrimidine pyrophosphatase-like HAD family hydrolase|nr:STM4011 family radical SAM protein [Tannerellaceae bacterium]
MNRIRNIYFRGSLRSCNYQCSYCSFGKKIGETDKERDQQAHSLFYDNIAQWIDPLRIMLIPYGEGLIHTYYQEAMIRLSLLSHVEGISCQTNLSFQPSSFIKRIQAHHATIAKIKLWASFHPEMTSIDTFIEKVHQLYYAGIELCVGVVGSRRNKDTIAVLRQKLDKRIYLFINALQGGSDLLHTDDISFFTSIDPFFLSDYKNAKADISRCSGGRDTIFVNHKGNVHPCPRNPVKIGDITDRESFVKPVCPRERCDCYIGYSNLPDTRLSRMMGKGILFRIPEKRKIEAIFFDIDGTLTDSTGRISGSCKEAVELLSETVPLYLATALPLLPAKRRLGNLFHLFTGGVFADGAHIHYQDNDVYIPLKPIPDIQKKGCEVREYIAGQHIIYKYVLKMPSAEQTRTVMKTLENQDYNLHHQGVFLAITAKKAGKKSGLETICRKEHINLKNVVAIGNTAQDSSMLSAVGYPCAVLDAEDTLKQMAGYILNPDHLPLFFKS